eukprot:m.97680 g.97680  ORF g.97680 m.97680 type:complete len:168 (+) comp13108_c0_seq1:149-652(+)
MVSSTVLAAWQVAVLAVALDLILLTIRWAVKMIRQHVFTPRHPAQDRIDTVDAAIEALSKQRSAISAQAALAKHSKLTRQIRALQRDRDKLAQEGGIGQGVRHHATTIILGTVLQSLAYLVAMWQMKQFQVELAPGLAPALTFGIWQNDLVPASAFVLLCSAGRRAW